MDWKETYKAKSGDIDQVFKNIKDGDVIVMSGATASPNASAVALAKRLRDDDINHVVIIVGLPLCIPYLADDIKHKVEFRTVFTSGGVRKHINEGPGEYLPIYLKDWGFGLGPTLKPDVAIVSVAPPDDFGFCSLSLFNLYIYQTMKYAKLAIAEVNPNYPRTQGERSHYHVSEFDYFVESNTAPFALPKAEIGPVEEAIGGYIAEYIKDGDCLQLGIGSIPDAVVGFLKDRKDLGVHTEMFSDGIMDLWKAGVVTCKRKNYHEGKIVTGFVMGSLEFYKWLDNNPMIMLVPGEYSNDPVVIGKNDNMVSINSCVEVDFFGQASSESIGGKMFSGIGGQVDFVRGAFNSKGGRSFLAFPSTAGKPGQLISRIVPQFAAGTPVSTPRSDVEYVVTEYGVANLRYKTMRERALALIGIAHPDFRADLKAQLGKMPWI